MKVGTDGVLLGAWTDVSEAHTVLDIGTGTGLVALMLAQRCDANIYALEIEASAVLQAKENVDKSPWKNRIEVVAGDFTAFVSALKYDIIVSNPPYFIDSLLSPDDQRTAARHAGGLSYEALIKGVIAILSSQGVFSVILPTGTKKLMEEIAQENGLYTVRETVVITRPGVNSKRTLLSFAFQEKEYVADSLLVELERHHYSSEYIILTKDYYLKM